MSTVLIVGLGDSLVNDDGIGVQVARLLMTDPPPGSDVIEVGTDLMSLVSHLERHPQVLVIDALEAGGRPGMLYEHPLDDMSKPWQRGSLHELGLRSVLEFIDPIKWPKITLLGIQPKHLGYALELSAQLQARLPEVARAARKIVARLQRSHAESHRRQDEAATVTSVKRPRPTAASGPIHAASDRYATAIHRKQ